MNNPLINIFSYLCFVTLGFASCMLENVLESHRMSAYLANNLITLAVALMAINSVVLVIGVFSIKTTLERWGKSIRCIGKSINSMSFSLKEFIVTLAIAIIAVMCYDCEAAKSSASIGCAVNSALFAVLYCCAYCLYDSVRGMLVFVWFDPPDKPPYQHARQ